MELLNHLSDNDAQTTIVLSWPKPIIADAAPNDVLKMSVRAAGDGEERPLAVQLP